MTETFNSLKAITGLPFIKRGSKMIAACYIDGTPHHQKDKTFAVLKEYGIYIKENGGDDISLKEWLIEYGDVSKLKDYSDKEPTTVNKPKKLFINEDAVDTTMPMYYENNLFQYLSGILGYEKTLASFRKYNVGEISKRCVCFWYVNELGQYVHDSVVPYGVNGKREKDIGGWRNYKVDDGYYGNCMFGQHLLANYDGDTCVVESEKTAIIMDIVDTQNRLWLATGGSTHLACIRDNWKLYPDFDNAGSFWECIGCKDKSGCIIKNIKGKRTKEFKCRHANKSVVYWWKGLDIKSGWDVADWVLGKFKGGK
jgi:hypothetical protein